MGKRIHVMVEDEERAKELEAVRHIETIIKPLQDRVKQFKNWADEEATKAAGSLEAGAVVTLQLGKPENTITATAQERTGFDRKRLFVEHPDYVQTYTTKTTFWRKQI